MKCAEVIEIETPAVARHDLVRMPNGMLGFEAIKDYVLTSNPEEQPFAWLKVQDSSALAFVVIDPFIALPDYLPDIPQGDVEFLKLNQANDAQLLAVVTIHNAQRATVNLKGPIVVNRHTRVAKQVIIANASAYSVTHPLPLTEAAA
ncbi:MAG: flagellar assembly protein FliW [Verrucomicrobiota bacterium]|jgi:flagellar assembly factor FliW